MKTITTNLNSIILICKNIERTSNLYSQALGLRVYIQSKDFIELRDQSNFKIYLKGSASPAFLHKGYTPMLRFKV